MANQPARASTASSSLQAAQVYGMASLCLAVAGLATGYLLQGSRLPVSAAAQPAAHAVVASAPGDAMSVRQMPSLEEMKHMSDKQAEPLLDS